MNFSLKGKFYVLGPYRNSLKGLAGPDHVITQPLGEHLVKKNLHRDLDRIKGVKADSFNVQVSAKDITRAVAKSLHDAITKALRDGEAGTVKAATAARRSRKKDTQGNKALYATGALHASLVLQNTSDGARTVGDADKLEGRTLELFEELIRKKLSEGATVDAAIRAAIKLLDPEKK